MRLGYVLAEGRGALDPLLVAVASRLLAEGQRLGGVVQINADRPGQRCDMQLHILGGEDPQGEDEGGKVLISQRLGAFSRSCRLDETGLETAVARVAAQLAADPPALLIINKFGKAELGGRGFRPVIAQALDGAVPVLVGVARPNLDGFLAFAGDLAEPVAANESAILDWCRDLVMAPD